MKYAIFDMDGTITESMGVVWDNAPGELLRRHGFAIRPDIRPRMMELTQEDGCRLLLEEYPIEATVPQLVEEFYQVVADLYQKVEPKPGVEQALRQMRAAGVQLAVASSTREDMVDAVLTRLGLRELFAGVFSCKDGKGKKAGPYVYQEAAEAMGAADPAEVWVFEDAHHAALSAKSGGFPVVGVQDDFCVVSPAEMAAACDDYLNDWSEFDLSKY